MANENNAAANQPNDMSIPQDVLQHNQTGAAAPASPTPGAAQAAPAASAAPAAGASDMAIPQNVIKANQGSGSIMSSAQQQEQQQSTPGMVDRFMETLGLKDMIENAHQQAAMDKQYEQQMAQAVADHNWGLVMKLGAQRLYAGAKQGAMAGNPAGAIAQGAISGAYSHGKNAVINAEHGNYAQASDEAAQAVPIVGPMLHTVVAPTAQDVGMGNGKGLVGDVAGGATQAALMLLGGGDAEAEEAANQAAKSELPAREGWQISGGTHSQEADHIATALGKDSKFSVPEVVHRNMKEIKEGIADTGAKPSDFEKGKAFGKGTNNNPLSKTGRAETATARRSAPQIVEEGIDRAVQIHNKRVQPLIDHVSTDVVPDEVWEKNPALKQEFAERLEKGDKITYGDINNKRIELNQAAGRSGFYRKPPSGQMNVTDKVEQTINAGNEARNALYDHIEKQTGVDVRPIKQREGDLIKLRDLAHSKRNELDSAMGAHGTESVAQKPGHINILGLHAHSNISPEGVMSPGFWFNRHMRLGLGDFEPGAVTRNGELINPPNWNLKLNPTEGSAAPGPNAQENVPFNEGFSQDMQTSPNENLTLTPPEGQMAPPEQRPMPFSQGQEAQQPNPATANHPEVPENQGVSKSKGVYPAAKNGEAPAEPVHTNGSGESAASQEAINRKASEKANGVSYYKVDTRKPGTKIPLKAEANASDLAPGDHEAIIKVNKDGSEEVMAQGAKAKALPAKQAPKESGVKYKTEAEQNAAAKKIMSKQHVSSEMNYFDQAAQEASRKYGKPYHELTTEQRSAVMQRAQELKAQAQTAAKTATGQNLRSNLKDVLKQANLGGEGAPKK